MVFTNGLYKFKGGPIRNLLIKFRSVLFVSSFFFIQQGNHAQPSFFLGGLYTLFCAILSLSVSSPPFSPCFPHFSPRKLFVLTLSKPNRQQINFFSSSMGCGASKTSKGSIDVIDLSSRKQPLQTTTITVQEQQRSQISVTGDMASSVVSPQPKVEFVNRFTSYCSLSRFLMFLFIYCLSGISVTTN